MPTYSGLLFTPNRLKKPNHASINTTYIARNRSSTPINTVINIIPEQELWIIERMGKFHRILRPGLNWIWPIFDHIKCVQTVQEIAIDVPKQSAISADNVTLNIDGVVYLKIVNALLASYTLQDPEFAIMRLAQTTMTSKLGKISLDKVFREREFLTASIVESINEASKPWGIKCLRYEIRDIELPFRVQQAMHMQVEAEQKKRAAILESEGVRAADINVAEGKKQARILASEAKKVEAKQEAEAIVEIATAKAQAINYIGDLTSEFQETAIKEERRPKEKLDRILRGGPRPPSEIKKLPVKATLNKAASSSSIG